MTLLPHVILYRTLQMRQYINLYTLLSCQYIPPQMNIYELSMSNQYFSKKCGVTCGGGECERYAASTALQCIEIDLVSGARLQTLHENTEKFMHFFL